jgi:hypothetical protein
MYLFVHSAVNFDRDLAALFCVQEKFSQLASSGHITLYFGGGGTGVF